uniref:Uncharacterized protein n=1 Tax=Octactis speculum TaxID=3111310 RepID=A0A6U3VGI0_9STRA
MAQETAVEIGKGLTTVKASPGNGQYLSIEEREKLEKQKFNLNIGFAIDTLRDDIPNLLTTAPDMSIFTENIRISDPTGEKFQGIKTYTHLFRAMRGMSTVALQDTSKITARFFWDRSKSTLRAKVDAELRVHGMPAHAEPMHLSLVSLYEFDSRGLVNHHIVQRLDIDGNEQEPLSFLTADANQLRQWLTGGQLAQSPIPLGSATNLAPATSSFEVFEGFKAMFNAEDQQLDIYGNIVPPSMQKKGEAKMEKQARKPGFFDFLNDMTPDICEDDWQCPTTQHCCDFLVSRVCCGGGLMVGRSEPQLQPAYIPIPSDNGPGGFPGI